MRVSVGIDASVGAEGACTSDTEWVAIAYGAIDVKTSHGFPNDVELVVLPTKPSTPLALPPAGAMLWERLVAGPVADSALSVEERAVVQEMEDVGLATRDLKHDARVRRIGVPWLSSSMHELVYGLVQRVALELHIPLVVIKGPVLHRQGLREREHSGDVDVLTAPDRVDDLVKALAAWGWNRQPDIWDGTTVNHSVTLTPEAGWGCEIDVHRRMPGLAIGDEEAFTIIHDRCDVFEFAGVEVRSPAREVHAVLAGVHHMRPEIGIGRRSGAEARAAEALRAGGEAAFDVLVQLDAIRALDAVLPQAFENRAYDLRSAGRSPDWAWRGQPTRARAYWCALKTLPVRARLPIALRLLWPKKEVAAASERKSGGASEHIITARLRRLRRGLASAFRRTPRP